MVRRLPRYEDFWSNTIGDSDAAIVVTSDDSSPSPYNGDADDTTITFNRVLGMSPAFAPDGALYICSNGNEISGNQISGTAVGPAIMLDNTCTSTIVTGNNNTVADNSINEACAGEMRNTGTTAITSVTSVFQRGKENSNRHCSADRKVRRRPRDLGRKAR